MMNKKGSALDNLLIVLLPLIFLTGIIIVWIGISYTNAALDEARETVQLQSFNESLDMTIGKTEASFPAIYDFIIVLFIFGIYIGLLIIAYLLDNNAVFTIIYVLLVIIIVFVSIFIINSFYTFLTEPSVEPYTDSFPMTMFVITYYLYIEIFMFCSIGVALFMKSGGNRDVQF